MEHIVNGSSAADFSSDAKARVSSPSRQAYQILHLGLLGALALARLSHEFDR